MNLKTNKLIKILKTIDQIWPKTDFSTDENTPGRKQIYSDLNLFKVFIVMILLNINTIKGIWRFLINNKRIRRACGLEKNIDRTTLNRRLSDKIKNWF